MFHSEQGWAHQDSPQRTTSNLSGALPRWRGKQRGAPVKARTRRRIVRRKKSTGYYATGSGSLGPRLLQLGYKDYSAYLSSNRWQAIRTRLIAIRGSCCAICDARDERINVHHRTYERFGDELDGDLILLCRACHDTIHQRENVGVGLEDALNRRIKAALPRDKRDAARIRIFGQAARTRNRQPPEAD